MNDVTDLILCVRKNILPNLSIDTIGNGVIISSTEDPEFSIEINSASMDTAIKMVQLFMAGCIVGYNKAVADSSE